ncbi:Protein C2-DOMAIN ABA-RELATED 11, partial [Cucurbita argyrosperma subsp. sororia]
MAVETSGRLKVIIIQGRDLVIRDFKTSDPYVVVKLGKQPMQSASRLSKILGISGGETTLRKVVPGMDDCFQEEYSIRCVDGEVVQDVWLRLTGVESGEIQVRIIYVEDESVRSWATNCKREFC